MSQFPPQEVYFIEKLDVQGIKMLSVQDDENLTPLSASAAEMFFEATCQRYAHHPVRFRLVRFTREEVVRTQKGFPDQA